MTGEVRVFGRLLSPSTSSSRPTWQWQAPDGEYIDVCEDTESGCPPECRWFASWGILDVGDDSYVQVYATTRPKVIQKLEASLAFNLERISRLVAGTR